MPFSLVFSALLVFPLLASAHPEKPSTVSFNTPDFHSSIRPLVFKKWQRHFGKTYSSVAEEAHRFTVFISNWRKIHQHNAGNSSYTMGLNQFGDLTPNEFRMEIHGHTGMCVHGSSQKKLSANSYYDPSLTIVKAPAAVDWSTKGVVTQVKNQGQCGSCWAFSTTGSIESRNAIKTGKLVALSEQQLVDCSKSYGNNGCNGGLMDYGFQYVKDKGGLCSEQEYPYMAADGTCKETTCGTKFDPITGFVDVQQMSEPSLEAAVAQGPVSIAIEADESAFQFYKKGVLAGACGAKLDHGVLVVGYGTDAGKDYWKVKNSWGTAWGEMGYIRLCRNCNKNSGQGECGILDNPSYPTV